MVNTPLHLFLSVGELEVVDEEAQSKQLSQGSQEQYCQEFQTENKVLRFCLSELEFEREVFLGLPEVRTEYQHGDILITVHIELL